MNGVVKRVASGSGAGAKPEPNLLDRIGRGSQPAPARNRSTPAGKRSAGAALKPSSDRQTYSDRVRREGTQLQRDQARELSIRLPAKTEFKQGGPDHLAGMADGPRHNVNMAIHVGKKMAHSRIIGVAQLGEGIGLATDIVKGLNGVINGAPKFFSDAGDLLGGRTKTSKREVAAGVVSGAGKFAYGMGSGLVDLGARIVTPGEWRANVSKSAGQAQQWLDNGYRGAVKSVGVNPDAKGYSVASTTTQIVGTVGSFFLPAKAVKGSSVTKAVKVGAKESQVGNAVCSGAQKVSAHPVEGLKNAVQLHKEGKLGNAALNEAMTRANEAFKAQKGADVPSWTPEMRKNFVSHSGDANGAVSGATARASTAARSNFARRPGETMHDYLARQGVKQSLSASQQNAADRAGMKMSSKPEPSPRGGVPSRRSPPDAVTTALKMRMFSNNARAIADPARFKTYLDHLDGQPLSTAIRIGHTGTGLNEFTLADRSREYRSIDARKLAPNTGAYFTPQMTPAGVEQSHEVHTAFGAVSKVGEVNANSVAFGTASASPWASRGKLPGADGKAMAQHWAADYPEDWAKAERALTALDKGMSTHGPDAFANTTVEPLREKGFIPKGSPLATRLERLEAKVAQRNELHKQLGNALPADVPRLTTAWRAAGSDVAAAVESFAGNAAQSRMELLTESLGTPKTTYELTTRHAAAARYIESVANQPNAVFDTTKFHAILGAVKREAGSETTASLRWHQALIENYAADPTFAAAMRQSEPMRQAWAAYKARYGL